MRETSSRAPIFVAIALLLPILYLASYLALVVPAGCVHRVPATASGGGYIYISHYRIPGRPMELFYWPLEHIDRTLRPRAWQRGSL